MIETERAVVPFPAAPPSLEQAGLSVDLMLQLVLKTLHFAGTLTGIELSERLGVPFPVIEPALDQLKWQAHCEIVAGAIVGGPGFKYRITDAGRQRAALFLEKNHYVGFAPVPLNQYCDYMRAFRDRVVNPVNPSRVRETLRHLVLGDRVLDGIGPAVRAGRSLFVYGAPGNGKTVISRAIHDLLEGEIAIPHALEVEGAIVQLYDPVNHGSTPEGAASAAERLDMGPSRDLRWARCRRPFIMVGGEMTLASMELGYNPATGFYRAPVQVTANGGMLVIDDFGRQQCSPRDLLNRWIAPLEAGTVFMTLQTGQNFEVPFATLVVFATNIRPSELVEEAFLRRIQYKVLASDPTEDDFLRIWEKYCGEVGVPFDAEPVRAMLADYYRPHGIALRGCQPRDLINHALAIAEYNGQERLLTPSLLSAACDSYFVDDANDRVEYT